MPSIRSSLLLVSVALTFSVGATASTLGYLQQKSDQFQTRYYVYQCADCAGNHFPARGEFDNASANTVPTMDEISSGINCIEITCITAKFDPLKAVWGGWYFMNGVLGPTDRTPTPNWGTKPDAGLSLQGATTLHFWARGKRGGEIITFFCGGVGYDPDSGNQVAPYPESSRRLAVTKTLNSTWTEYEIPLAGADLSYILGGFGWVAAASDQKDSSTVEFYLDDIYYDLARPNDARLLVSYETLNSGQPFDMVLRDAAFLYDSSLALFAFLGAADLPHARVTADAILYGQGNDRYFTDNRIRNAYQAGDIELPPGWAPNGKLDTVRMPGWYDTAHTVWYEDETQVSTNTGNVAWAGLSLMGLWEVTKDQKYLVGARALGDWVLNNTTDTRPGAAGTLGGFTGGDDGWESIAAASNSGPSCASQTFSNGQCVRGYKSVEHNIDLLSFFSRLYAADGDGKWAMGAANARHFVAAMWGKDHFWTGTGEDGVTISQDVVPTDIQAWALLALGTESQPYLASLDYLDTHSKTSLGYGFKQNGNNACGDYTWFEGSSQVGLANLLFGRAAKANSLLAGIHSVQTSAGGVPATDGPCLSTGFNLNDGSPWQYYPRVHVGATSWLWLFENAFNPYRPEIYQPMLSPGTADFGQVPASTSVSRTFTLNNPGPAQLTLSKVALSGAAAAGFGLSTTCAGTLAPKASCAITVTFNGGATSGVAELDVVEMSDVAMLPVTLAAGLSASSAGSSSSYTLSISADPPSGGNVSVAPEAASYAPGTTVCLKPVPAAGWTFAGWFGDIPDSGGCLLMNSNKAVTARFASPVRITQLSVPAWGANPATITGTLSGPGSAGYKIAPFVFLTGQGWFTKPTCAQTTVPVSVADGSFSALLTTGGTDQASTEIALIAVPASYTAACYSGVAGLPTDVLQTAVAKLVIHRPNPAEREVRFSGQSWGVKASSVPIGPGGCVFSDSPDNVFVDSGGSLHLRLINSTGGWSCAEVYSRAATGYGVYTWTIPTLPMNDAPVVFGAFSWEDAVQNSKEIDVEIGFQQANDPTTGQFVVQPFNTAGNLQRITLPTSVPITFRVTWLPGQLLFQAFSGVDAQGTKITEWQYSGTVPSALANYLNFRFNLWLNGALPSSGALQEAVISNYSWQPFYPDGSGPYIDGIANIGDYSVRGAPGGSIAAFGRGFPQVTAPASSVPLPLSLSGASVSVNGLPAPLYYAGASQINLQVPYEIGSGSALVSVSVNGNAGPSFAFPITPAAPAAFLSATGGCLAQNQDLTLNSQTTPAVPGSALILYLTGIGAVDNPVSTGSAAPLSPLSRPTLPSSAQVDSNPADLQFVGLVPGLIGIAQANVKIPDAIASGSHSVIISVGGYSTSSCAFYSSGNAALPPRVAGVSPAFGPPSGGTPVTITGANFQPGATALFGLVSSKSVTVASGSSMTAVAPSGSGTVDIKVVNPDGQSVVAPLAFTYTAGTASLSGRVYDVNNAGIGGVLLTVTGTHPATATTVADGSASIPGFLTTDTYTITPSKANYTFTPAQASGTVGDGQTIGFLGITGTFTLSGHATYQPGGAPAPGVVVSISGPRNDSATTAADGSYQFTGLNYNDYVNYSGAKPGYVVPTRGSIRISNNTTVDFQVFQPTLTVRVADANNVGIGGVLLTVTGTHPATATTVADGSASIPGFLTTDTYTITPSKANYTFTPAQASGTVGDGQTIGFLGITGTFTLSGHATYQPGGAPAPGVVVSISGPRNDSATTAADGSYQFTGLNYNDYVNYSGAKPGYVVPTRGSIRISNNTTVDFQVFQPTLTVRVADANNVGIGGVLLTVTGTHPATATTVADGSASIPGFLTTDTYTITPSKANYTFTPAQASGTVGDGQTIGFLGITGTFTLSGHATYQPGGAPAPGVVVSISGPRNDSATTAADGSYQFTGLNYNDYVNYSGAKPGYVVPTRGSIRISNNTTVDFQVFQPTLTVRVADANNAGIGGVLLTVTGTHPATATTVADGSASIPGFLTTDTYTITPSKANYTFTPAQASGTVGDGQTIGFLGITGTFTLSGHATYQPGGAPAPGVVVSISGPRNDSATTAADGSYQFTGLNYNDYVNYSGAKPGYVVPTRGSIRISNNTTVDFQVFQPTLTVRVADANNVGIGGVLLTVTGTHPATATTVADGSASIPGFLTTDTYTITPSKANYTFTPAQASGTVGDGQTIGFLGITGTFTLSGHATYQPGGAPAPGVVVSISGPRNDSATTAADGSYQFTGLNYNDYVNYSGAKPGYVVPTRGSIRISNNTTVDFQVFQPTLTVRVADANNAGIGGVLLTVTGTHPATATTVADGSASIPGFLTTDTYTITPSKANYTFTPAQASGTVGDGQTIGFLGITGTFTLSGHATYQPGGAPAPGVVVSISGPRNDSATTAADGSYQFTGLNYNDYVNYSGAKPGYVVPTRGSIRISNNTTVDFQVFQPTLTVRVADANNVGIGGVLLTVTGTHPATATTVADGSASIPGFLTTDTYTITPSKANYTFTPAQASGTVANGATLSFVGAANPTVSNPSITATVQGGTISGSVSGVTPLQAFRVAAYAYTNAYYVQPCITTPVSPINPNGTFGPIQTHNGTIYVLLVGPSYSPPSPTGSLPSVDGVNVLAATGPVGTVTGADVSGCPAQ